MTEHEVEQPFRYYTYMVAESIVKAAAYRAIRKCRDKVGETRQTLHTDFGIQGMVKDCWSATDVICKTLNDAEQTLHRVGGSYVMDQWLAEQPEWLQCAVANEVGEWVNKTFGE